MTSKWLLCCILQAAMCYVHVAALVAEFLLRKSKCLPSRGTKRRECYQCGFFHLSLYLLVITILQRYPLLALVTTGVRF